MLRALSACGLVSLVVALVGSKPTDAEACAAVGRKGPITISGEEALVVWDPERRVQHFVRMAAFDGVDADFGFLVPTPSQPQLAEVDGAVFQRLFRLYRAPIPRGRTRSLGGPRTRIKAKRKGVKVLERRSVAGLDAAVLDAADAGALDRWLAKHGYPSGPALRTWLAPYVAKGWIVTAFRIDPSALGGEGFATSAVRMSFETARPFFPYSEPGGAAGAEQPGRPFRVSVVAPTRTRAVLGGKPWGARVGYAKRSGARLAKVLEGVVPAGTVGPSSWLTVFDEPASRRGPHDLEFERDHARPVRSTIRTRIQLAPPATTDPFDDGNVREW